MNSNKITLKSYLNYFAITGIFVAILISIMVYNLFGLEFSSESIIKPLLYMFGFWLFTIIAKRVNNLKIFDFDKREKIIACVLIIILFSIHLYMYVTRPFLKTLSTSQALEYIDTSDEVHLIYTTDDCYFCQKQKTKIKDSNLNEYNIYYVNLDDIDNAFDGYTLISKMNIKSVPVTVKYSKGKEVGRLNGLQEVENIEKFIKESKND